jgi:hypothetical protein
MVAANRNEWYFHLFYMFVWMIVNDSLTVSISDWVFAVACFAAVIYDWGEQDSNTIETIVSMVFSSLDIRARGM